MGKLDGKTFSSQTPHTDEWRTNSRSCYKNSCRIAREHKFRKEFLFVACCEDKIKLSRRRQGRERVRIATLENVFVYCLISCTRETEGRLPWRYAKWGKASITDDDVDDSEKAENRKEYRTSEQSAAAAAITLGRAMYRGGLVFVSRCVVVHSKCKYRSDSLE